MTKHPLLPDDYTERTMQTAILFALSPYKISERADIANPHQKWNLHKAWEDAEALLTRGGWRYKGGEQAAEIGYELLADTQEEIKDLNTVIAGIIAHQILDPESGLALHRIEHRKGGEMAMALSGKAGEKLKKMYPSMLIADAVREEKRRWWNFFKAAKRQKTGDA